MLVSFSLEDKIHITVRNVCQHPEKNSLICCKRLKISKPNTSVCYSEVPLHRCLLLHLTVF